MPGAPTKLTCPHCGKSKYIESLLSGNTFGARLWSDSKRFYPMWHSPSPVQQCPHCGGFFFFSDSNPLNYRELKGELKAEWLFPEQTGHAEKTALSGESEQKRLYEIQKEAYTNGFGDLSFKEMDKAFQALYPQAEVKERRADLLFLWLFSYNDMFGGRQEGSAPACSPEICDRHRYVLEELCRMYESDRIFVAELHRELGDFDGCIRIAKKPMDGDPYHNQIIRSQIIDMAEMGKTDVFEVIMVRPSEKNLFELDEN